MRKGFGLLIAIIFVVTIASLGAVALKLSVGTAKQTGDVYVREQGEILLRSFAEYTMLNILTHDFDVNCLEKVKGWHRPDLTIKGEEYPAFVTSSSIKYFGTIGKCNGVPITTKYTQGTVIIDIFVEYVDSLKKTKDDKYKISEKYPVRLHKRIIQKI
ncbi:hypothetical protein [Campylobacter pinnipediorum]|uniref:hypothetical protein n=1 Tax=Campylobacter pinnipediorum TaxID=1965231 RepID=UPI00084D1F54|nr:hypothetical protein [Campylobacter pinnipediorum]AQW81058.1 hypothetical protein CPIN17260_0756 [Campylobacter pinnipediorum subsp. pinnipediorum]AQW82676.1 hypothetical protein CPIN17261_0663 [Campylobacter pinnipediorum subsp. pinnipediorum]